MCDCAKIKCRKMQINFTDKIIGGVKSMDRIDELTSLLKGVIKTKEEEKKINIVAIVLTAILVAVAIGAAIYAIYRFVRPEYDDDFEDDFGDDDDLDEFFEDEDDEPIPFKTKSEAKPKAESESEVGAEEEPVSTETVIS